MRVLLPPPLGLVIDVARDLNDKPEAALLEIMINRAAEKCHSGGGANTERDRGQYGARYFAKIAALASQCSD